jgi:hypothetical protein
MAGWNDVPTSTTDCATGADTYRAIENAMILLTPFVLVSLCHSRFANSVVDDQKAHSIYPFVNSSRINPPNFIVSN